MSDYGNAACQFLDERKSYTIVSFGEAYETGHVAEFCKLVCQLTASPVPLFDYPSFS